MKDYDFLILGGGSAGYNAAATACRLGLRVALVEGGEALGGLCILHGCMPSKALIESANRYTTLRRAGEFGLHTAGIGYSVPDIQARKDRLVAEFADYRAKQLEGGMFDFYRGWAGFFDPHTVEFTDSDGNSQQLRAETFLLATGSHLKIIDVPGLIATGFLDSDAVLGATVVPKSVIVLGGGATAVEFSHYYEALGARVTIIQRSGQLLKDTDGDVAHALAEGLRKRGIDVFCHTQLQRVERTDTGAKRVVFGHAGETVSVEADEIIYALGREPQLTGLNLERAGIVGVTGCLTVSPTQQTCVPHIFAAGDVAGPYEIVHIAIQQGEIAARNAAKLVKGHGSARPLEEIDYRLRLFAVFGSPEVAMVGLTEQELQGAAVPYRVATYQFCDHGKSLVMGETDGFVKLLASEESGEIIGAAVVGPHASELIHEIVVAMRFRATAGDLAAIPHYHPTLSEIWTYPAEELM